MQSQILDIIQQFPWLTVGELASRCELPSAAVSALLRDLRKSKQVISTGNRRTTRYALAGTELPSGELGIEEVEDGKGGTFFMASTVGGVRTLLLRSKSASCAVQGTDISIEVSRAAVLRALENLDAGELARGYLYADGSFCL